MKRFLRKTFLFSLGILVLNFSVLAVVAPLERDDSYLTKARGSLPGTRGIVLADSHGTRLDDAALLAAGIANLSSGSDSYDDMLNKLEYAVRQYPIDLVILTVDGHCMSKYREYTNNLDKSGLLVGGSGVKATIRRFVPLVDPKGRDLFKAAVSVRMERTLAGKPKAGVAPALTPVPRTWKDRSDRKALSERRAGTQFKFAQASLKLKATLERIDGLCRREGIRLVGLKFPLSGDYLRELKGKDYGAAAAMAALGERVLDHERLYQDRDELFEDQDHLNPAGGKIFTELLIEELRGGGDL